MTPPPDGKPRQRRNPISGRLLEGAVIILSILMAFAVDAWWDGRQEDEARAALLEALSTDLAAARLEAARVQGYHTLGQSAVIDLLQLRGGPAPTRLDAPRIDTLMSHARLSATFDAPLGSTEALLANGAVAFLENGPLVGMVTEVQADVADLEREQESVRHRVDDLYVLLADRGVDTSDLDLHPDLELDVPRRPTTTWAHVMDPEIRSALGHLANGYRNTTLLLERLIERLEGAADLAAPRTP